MAACLQSVFRGSGYHDSAISAGLITLLQSHNYLHGSAPPHAPDTKSYVTAYLESQIALGWWLETFFICLTKQEIGGRRGGGFTGICHYFYERHAREALQRHEFCYGDVFA